MEPKIKCYGKCWSKKPISKFNRHVKNVNRHQRQIFCRECAKNYAAKYWKEKDYNKRRNELRSGKSTRLGPARPVLPATA